MAEAIADYEAMTAAEQGKMVVQILEDQPVLMGFITNLADDFSDSEHEALVDSAVILIDAFVAAGIPVQMVPHQMVEVIPEMPTRMTNIATRTSARENPRALGWRMVMVEVFISEVYFRAEFSR